MALILRPVGSLATPEAIGNAVASTAEDAEAAAVKAAEAAASVASIPSVVTPLLDDAIAAADIPGQVEAGISSSPTVIAKVDDAITDADIPGQVESATIGLNLVLRSDLGAPVVTTDIDDWAYRFVNEGGQAYAGFTYGMMLRALRGMSLGGQESISGHTVIPGYSIISTDIYDRIGEDAYTADRNKPQWVLNRWKTRMGLDAAASKLTTLVVRPTPGAGEFASPKLANDTITGSSDTNRFLIQVYPGTYSETEWIVKPYTTIRGTDRRRCILEGSNVDSAIDAVIDNTSVLWLNDTATLEELTISIRNGRYAVHSESSNAVKNFTHKVKGCRIIHYGNDAAKKWRDDNPGSGMSSSTVWSTETPWGYGTSSGGFERYEDTEFIGTTPWIVHDNNDFADPAKHEFVGCTLASPLSAGSYIDLRSLGSGMVSTVRIETSALDFTFIRERDSPWNGVNHLVSNHSEILATVGGMDPIGFFSTNRGLALCITSASTSATSTVRVSGTAAPALFGQATYRDGGGGLQGFVWGQWDISGILVTSSNTTVNNTLGRRLGNLTSAPLTLSVSFNGGAAVNVVLDQNYTAVDNATIIASINTAIGAAGTASTYNPSTNGYSPRFPDREATLRCNAGSVGIPQWAAVQWTTTSRTRIIPMGTATSLELFAGIALEPIPPQAMGRVLKSGLMNMPTQTRGGLTTAVAGTDYVNNAPFYFSDTVAGELALTGTRRAGTIYQTDWARF